MYGNFGWMVGVIWMWALLAVTVSLIVVFRSLLGKKIRNGSQRCVLLQGDSTTSHACSLNDKEEYRMKRTMVSRYIVTGLAAVGICMASGCATQDTVSSRFTSLEANINAAKTAGAGVYAPTPLKSAEAKLEAARSAVTAGEMVAASRYVDEAMVDADYARAKATTEKAKMQAVKMRETIQALRDEIQRMPALPASSIKQEN